MPSPVHLAVAHTELTSNFCFCLWWLRVSGSSLRAALLSSRRQKPSKCCTPGSWKGRTSFLSCGRGQKSSSHLKQFSLSYTAKTTLCLAISSHLNNGSLTVQLILNKRAPLVMISASSLPLSVGEGPLRGSRWSEWKTANSYTHARRNKLVYLPTCCFEHSIHVKIKSLVCSSVKKKTSW